MRNLFCLGFLVMNLVLSACGSKGEANSSAAKTDFSALQKNWKIGKSSIDDLMNEMRADIAKKPEEEREFIQEVFVPMFQALFEALRFEFKSGENFVMTAKNPETQEITEVLKGSWAAQAPNKVLIKATDPEGQNHQIELQIEKIEGNRLFFRLKLDEADREKMAKQDMKLEDRTLILDGV